MTDRELLERAAKAAGYTLKWGEVLMVGDDEVDCTDQPYVVSGQPDEADWYWNPLEDDGDALRLAVKLRLNISHTLFSVTAWTNGPEIDDGVSAPELVDEESRREAATRRAIVRAAAAMGGE